MKINSKNAVEKQMLGTLIFLSLIGLAGYHGVGGVTGTSVYRSKIPRGNLKGFKRWG